MEILRGAEGKRIESENGLGFVWPVNKWRQREQLTWEGWAGSTVRKLKRDILLGEENRNYSVWHYWQWDT